MNCEQAKQALWDYYDEAATPAQRLGVESHLASCRACRSTLDEWVTLSQKAFRRPEVKAPPFLWTRVLAAIEAQEDQRTEWWRQWQWMSRLASVMTLLVSLAAGLVFYQSYQGAPMEHLLSGITNPQQASQMLPEQPPSAEQLTAWLVEEPTADKVASAPSESEGQKGGSSWEEN